MNVKYIVELHEAERQELDQLTRAGAPGARKMKGAQVLLMEHEPSEASARRLPALPR